MTKQTLAQAIHLARAGKSRALVRAVHALDGKPPGGWGETMQAWREMVGDLPLRSQRDYTADEFVDAVYGVDGGRFRCRFARVEVAS
jgi:hypothetical protein